MMCNWFFCLFGQRVKHRGESIALRRSRDGQHYFTFDAANGQVIATSETYKKRYSCVKAARLLQKTAGGAHIYDAAKE